MASSGANQGDIFDVKRIRRLVELMNEHELSEIDLRQADQRIRLRKGGEPVVTVTGDGRGGRAQQSALSFAIEMASLAGAPPNTARVIARVMAMFAGTDGIDGPTDAAGAIATSETIARAAEAHVDPHVALSRNDAYELFKALGDLIIIGPTGTNVADIFVALVNY